MFCTFAGKDRKVLCKGTAGHGSVINCKTTIHLTVSNEINTLSYQLQGSTDGSNFTNISTTPAHSNTNSTVDSYSFDVNPAFGNYSFYRIKSTDHDGNNNFSKVVYVGNNCNNADYLTIYPNPTKGSSIQLEYHNTSLPSKGIIRLINISGNTIWKKEIGIAEGNNHFSFPVTNLPVGQCYVQLVLHNGKTITKQIHILK